MSKYKFKEQADGTIFIEDENDDIVAKYKLDKRWREVNYSFKENSINIRLFNSISRKYKDATIELDREDLQIIDYP